MPQPIPPLLQHKAANPILRHAIAAFVALALVFGSSAPTFARDRNDDLAKAVAAAIVLGLIVNQIDKNKRHDRPQPAPVPVPLPELVRAPRVPEVCAIEVDGNRRSVTVYPESCLRDEGFDYRLPRDCAKTARIYGRADRIYGVQCLRSAGFRVAGH
jgi:hypothetical protein